MDELNYFQTFRFVNVMNAAVTPSRKAVLVRAIEDNFREMEWNVAISWQLQDLYVYVAITGCYHGCCTW